MAKQEYKSRALLYERLVDLAPQSRVEPKPFRVLSGRGLEASVCKELGQLFNTRCPTPALHYEEEEHTVIGYGIPDLLSFIPADSGDRRRLAAVLAKAIESFEPRLHGPKVTVEVVAGDPKALRVVIKALLVTEEVREPISFDLLLDDRTGRWLIHEIA